MAKYVNLQGEQVLLLLHRRIWKLIFVTCIELFSSKINDKVEYFEFLVWWINLVLDLGDILGYIYAGMWKIRKAVETVRDRTVSE